MSGLPEHVLRGRGATVAFATLTLTLVPLAYGEEVSFSGDVLPVLSDRCFHCHGPDENNREAGLRLDVEQAAKADLGGYAAITPGDLEDSEVWRRITAEDEGEIMPPADSHRKPLSAAERDAIRRWILAGAPWGKHWSFEAIRRPDLPSDAPPSDASSSDEANPIDAFVQARLADQGLQLSSPAEPHTQLRRLYFDLTGVAPTPAQLEAFGDGSEAAWQAAIDNVFASSRYAERMAMWWLDAARYSDSDGFQIDATRQNWPWRDWVIGQFRNNQSFRQFTIEQFAGDLLPDATQDQILATCFHRNHMTNGEGGRDPEESRIDYVIDRVNTTGTVWLGLTLGCVQCHSHKFDPISQHEYYSLAAFFNSIDENGRAGMAAKPYLEYTSPAVEERVEEMSEFVERCREEEVRQRQRAEARFETWLQQTVSAESDDYQTWHTPRPQVSSVEGTRFRVADAHVVRTQGPSPRHDDYRIVLEVPPAMQQVSGVRLEVFPDASHQAGRFTRDGNGEFTLTSVLVAGRRQSSPAELQLELAAAVADVEADKKRKTQWDTRYANIRDTLNDDARDGWTTEGVQAITPHVGVFELATPWQVEAGDRLVVILRHRSTHGHANIARFRLSLTSELGETVRRTDGASPLADLYQQLASEASIEQDLRNRLRDQFLLGDRQYQQHLQRLRAAEKQLGVLRQQAKPRKVMVLAERKDARATHVLERGVWDAKGDVVQPGVLASVLDAPAEQTRTRLDLARWIVDPDNPLTARVVVNLLWQIMFGQGLVRTPEDFGLQGEMPTHPKLLDYLAAELIQHDWDLQHILRLIATSKTYRQSSVATPEMLQQDPENRLLARAPRFRLPAWMIRDNALRVSGLLNDAVGGPPVYPYQPEGVWAEITMGRFDYQPSLGPDQYRRTLYAFWRRSSAPTFLFDSAQRRVCEVGVRRTNTPLHALTLMNDVTFLEASRVLADQMVAKVSTSEAASQPAESRQEGFQQLALKILSRRLHDDEREQLQSVWQAARSHYQQHPRQAIDFGTVGQQPPPAQPVAVDTAAWMTVASLLLNLDEAITRE
ncbi:PSD1 and planctomycete cytochrome C domain-containing protein [Roseimaritima sediminicola]|uniref:PSD1 and planctomycete cytochrome C domain-containing protein n=1 Tax=Roseimaritima sediminicola TaxID=2662066 RepID=UPI0012982DFE|nr:PSD1 and planctomycete cytochrome C domain-containing protein [Roseimaritima sediminicola]